MSQIIEVVGPDGTIVEFPSDTPRDVMTRVMRQRFGSQQPKTPRPASPTVTPPPSPIPASQSSATQLGVPEEFPPGIESSSVRAPEEYPPGIAGAGPMRLPRDFSIPVEAAPVAGFEPVQETEPILPAEASISSFVKGKPQEITEYNPTLLQRLSSLFPSNRDRASNEYVAREIARRQGIPVEQVYTEAGGARPIFNPEGRPPVNAAVEAAGVIAEEVPKIPAGVATAALRAYRAGEIPVADQSWVDRAITAMNPERKGKPDPNYQAFQGFGQSFGFSLANIVASVVAGSAATTVTGGNPVAGVAAGMSASGTVAYRASKDEFLERVKKKLDKESKNLYGKPLGADDWEAAKEEFDSAATQYGLWEAIPEAVSNAIFLKAFAGPAKGMSQSMLASVGQKAGALAAEQATETITALGQNAVERKAGLTQRELSVVDAFRQQFVQTLLTTGFMAGGMKGKELATDFYRTYVEPRVDPASALGRAIQADIDAVAFSPEAIQREAAFLMATGARPQGLADLARAVAVPPVKPGDEQEEIQGRREPSLPEEEPVVLRPTRRGADYVPIDDIVPTEEPSALRPTQRGPAYVPAEETPFAEEPTALKRTQRGPQFVPVEDTQEPTALQQTKRGPGFVSAEDTIEPPGAPAVVTPTPAAAAVPVEPTVPTFVKAKETEPEPPDLETKGLATVEVPLNQLSLSKEVPQFKLGATAKGVVEPLGGKFERTGVAPIQVWRRLDGSLEVISGRHRFDLAQRSGEKTIPAQVHDEAQGFTRDHAAVLDAELNIRDGQGKAKDYVNYFKASGIDRETAESRGLLARATGKRAYTIATQGSDELLAALRSDQISEEAAFYVALNAPNDSRLQAVGINALNDGKTMNAAINLMQAVKALAVEQDTTVDMFGFDDSGMREASEMAKIAARKQRELQARLSAITGAAKNPELAKAEGIDVKDPVAVKQRIEELRQQKAAWDNWSTNPDLIAEVRAERGTAAPQKASDFELTGESEADIKAREKAEKEGKLDAEKKRQADLARDMFTLEGETAPVETKTPEQGDIFAEAPAEPKTGDVVQTIPLPNNMETRVFKTSDGYGTGLFDNDSGNFVDGSITRFKGDDAQERAKKKAEEVAKEATPQEAAEPEAPVLAPVVPQNIQELQKKVDDLRSEIDKLGPEPPKPRTERQFFGKNGREGADPETVRRYDEGVKKYNAWKRKYGNLKKAEVDASNALFRATQLDTPQEATEPVDPIARAWSDLKTAEMPEFNELSSDAQATVQSLVEQGQLTPDVAREIAEDDEINRASPLSETIKAKVGVNKGRVAELLSQQLYGVTVEMPQVTLKELFQNAFDATKEAIEKGQVQQGNISVVFDQTDRSIEVIDNGMGMPASVMGKEFLEIAGSKKGTTRSSGGFGIAKVQFLYGNKQLEVISLRDGVLSKMVTTGDAVHAALKGLGPAPDIQITRDPDEIQQAIERYFPEGHGTSVKVTVPDVYENPDTRQTVELPFDVWTLPNDPSLRRSPLFTDVNVQYARLLESGNRDKLFDNRWRFDEVEIGSKFSTDSYAPISSVKFPWGSAVLYTSTKPTSTSENFTVLSNGLWQFTENIGSSPFKPLPRSFYIDIIPSKSAGELGYPFELNRQGFTKAAEKDVNAIKKYLKVLYSQTNLAEDVKNFGTVQYINNNGTVTTPAELKPSIPTSNTPTLPTIKPTDKVEIKDGRMSVNGKVLPDISEQEMKDMKIDVDALTIDQGEIDANKILFHNNVENKDTKDSLYKMAVDKFGEERVNKYFYGVGKTFLRLRNALVAVDPTYADMANEGIGISLDTKYLGVNIRVPFKGMFINPAYSKLSDTPAQVAVAMMGTMQHEMAHFKQRNHGGEFASEMQRINTLLDTHPSFDIFALKKYFIAHLKENEDIFNFLKTEFDSGNLRSIGKRFADSSYEQIRDDGDSGAVEGAGRGREGRPRVSEGAGKGVEAARESTEPTGVSGGTEGQRGRGAVIGTDRRKAQTQIPSFKQWFGGSIVVDKNGDPLVVYHGTNQQDDNTTDGAIGQFLDWRPIWFTVDPYQASGYATQDGRSQNNAAIYPVYLAIRKPFRVRGDMNDKITWADARAEMGLDVRPGPYSDEVIDGVEQEVPKWWIVHSASFAEAAQAAGFDGIYAVEGGTPTYAAFKPNQIKSAIGNIGTFSTTDPIITANVEFRGRGPNVATFFSGARTLEAALGDINTVMAVEYDKRINEFANTAFGTAFIARDVADVNVQEVKDADPVLFHASPVCKNFSAAKTYRGADDADRKSAEAVARIIRAVSPPVVTIENVPKYANTALFQSIVKALDDAGYTWDVVIHDAADYGAAQTRNRMLLRAVKDGDLPALPEKVGPSDWYKQIKDLLPDAPRSTIPPVERKRLDDMIKRGQLDPKKPIITMGGSGFKGTWSAANDGGPSPTLKAANEKARIILPNGEVKVVTPRMMARLMGLPDSFPVPDSPTLAKTVLGNGIHGSVTKSLIAPLLIQEAGPVAIQNLQEPSLAEQEGDLVFDSQTIRKEQIKEYAALRRKLGRVPEKVAEGKAGVELQRETTQLLERASELKQAIDETKPRRDTPERFLAKALEEYSAGNISKDVLDVIQAAYSKQPGLLNGLLLRVTALPKGRDSAAEFNPLARIVRLYKGTSGVDNPVSIRHELTHSLEQMMTPEQRKVIIDQWANALKRAMEKYTDPKSQEYFKAIQKFIQSPTQRNLDAAARLLPSYDMYQYINPSEYWAVNAEPLLAAQLGTPWTRFKMAVQRLFEGLKNVLGFDNKSDVYKTFKQVMNGDGRRISKDVLVNHIQQSGADTVLANVEAPQEERERVDQLLNEFNRPKVTGRELEAMRSGLMPSTTAIRSTFREMVDNPSEAVNMIFGPLNRGIARARNFLFFSGAGLEEADARKYANQVTTADGQATATLALDNMLHGNGIAVQFMVQGGLQYNSETKRIEAHRARGSMLDVYTLERQLKNKLGDERGAMLIQGYLEAKRSRSIQNEMAQLAETLEVQKETLDEQRRELADMQRRNASPQEIGRQQNDIDEIIKDIKFTAEQLDNITQINEDKVLMSEEEIEAFLMQDAAYPELRGIMDAWTATNQRLLKMMREVRLISEKRYDRLSSIQDYVPWQRVQDDDVDIHYVGNPRSATNIAKERMFKKGKVERAVDYIPDNMTDNIIRLTQSVLRQYAASRIVNDYATRNEDGFIQTFAKVDRNKGRFDYVSDGRRVVVEIKDPLIAEAIYGRDSADIRAPAAIAAATNFMRRAITIDPFFQMSQVIKDAPTAAIVTGVRNPAALMGSVMTSFVGTVLNTDPVADILRANGIGGFQAITRTPEAAIKRKKGLVNRSVGAATLEVMDHIGDASDFAARIAAYKRTIAETKSDQMPNGDKALAIHRAANVINFNRLGSNEVVRSIVTYVNFANAYLQSIDTLFTAMTARGARGRDTKKALGIMAATVVQLTALTLAYSWLVGGDEEYQKLDDGTKVRNFFIPKAITGLENGILIPINTTAAFIFKAFPELTYNMFVSQATKTPMDAARYKKAVSEAAADAFFGPEPVPTVIRPIVEVIMDRSFFTERPLTPRGMETLEKFQQFTDQTSELGKLLSQTGYLSPIEWDHLIRGTTGIAGMMAQYGSNMIGEYMNVRPESTAQQLPGVGRFIAPKVGRGPEALFYDLQERVRKAATTYKDLEATGQYEKAEKFDEKKNLLIDLNREMNRTESKLKKINSEIRMLSRGREEGTAKERRKEITELQRDKQELLEGIEQLRKDAGL